MMKSYSLAELQTWLANKPMFKMLVKEEFLTTLTPEINLAQLAPNFFPNSRAVKIVWTWIKDNKSPHQEEINLYDLLEILNRVWISCGESREENDFSRFFRETCQSFLSKIATEDELALVEAQQLLQWAKNGNLTFNPVNRDNDNQIFFNASAGWDNYSLPINNTFGLPKEEIKDLQLALMVWISYYYQNKIFQKDQQIETIHQVHEEFLDTQLNFYQQTKPELFTQFEASNPPNKTIGDLLNFLESKLQTQKQQVKQHLTNWITLINTKNK